MEHTTHYPSFDVMNEQDAWDDHTQSVVTGRLATKDRFRFLTDNETAALAVICGLLLDDSSPEVLRYVIHHIDSTLRSSPGEGQRKAGVPQEKLLIRQGLHALDESARHLYSDPFPMLDKAEQTELLHAVSKGGAEPASAWNGTPQKPFFEKLMSLTIESYCSHPKVWSEIGYAGPAYPRGYVRVQLGQLDPWEAKTGQ